MPAAGVIRHRKVHRRPVIHLHTVAWRVPGAGEAEPRRSKSYSHTDYTLQYYRVHFGYSIPSCRVRILTHALSLSLSSFSVSTVAAARFADARRGGETRASHVEPAAARRNLLLFGVSGADLMFCKQTSYIIPY